MSRARGCRTVGNRAQERRLGGNRAQGCRQEANKVPGHSWEGRRTKGCKQEEEEDEDPEARDEMEHSWAVV